MTKLTKLKVFIHRTSVGTGPGDLLVATIVVVAGVLMKSLCSLYFVRTGSLSSLPASASVVSVGRVQLYNTFVMVASTVYGVAVRSRALLCGPRRGCNFVCGT